MAEDIEKRRARERAAYERKIARMVEADPTYLERLAEKRRVMALSPEEKVARAKARWKAAYQRFKESVASDPERKALWRTSDNERMRRYRKIKDMPPEQREAMRAYWRAQQQKRWLEYTQTPEYQAKLAEREAKRGSRKKPLPLTREERLERQRAGFHAYLASPAYQAKLAEKRAERARKAAEIAERKAARDAERARKKADAAKLAEQKRQAKEARKRQPRPVKTPPPPKPKHVVLVDPEAHAHITPAQRAEMRKRWRMMHGRMA